MLWKPITPVYPRLVSRAPDGLTLEEASEMRKRGRNLPPICKLGKNGVYCDLVNNVREAFEECDLVRINCQGMNKSDYKKIGGKLKDLVPCILLSFQDEHVLMWRGRDWRSSYPKPEEECKEAIGSSVDNRAANAPNVADSRFVPTEIELGGANGSDTDDDSDRHNQTMCTGEDEGKLKESMNSFNLDLKGSPIAFDSRRSSAPSIATQNGVASASEEAEGTLKPSAPDLVGVETGTAGSPSVTLEDAVCLEQPTQSTESTLSPSESSLVSSKACTEGILLLRRQAIESGSALVLDDDSLDPNIVYVRAVALAKSAPPGPVFKNRFSKVVVQKNKKKESYGENLRSDEIVVVQKKGGKEKRSQDEKMLEDFTYEYSDLVPRGSLKIDELAKLLA